MGIDHEFSSPDKDLLKTIYRNMLLKSGDLCGACDIATKAHAWKTAQRHRIPAILYGTSPLEEDSFIPESIQDKRRFKYIMKRSGTLSRKQGVPFWFIPESITLNTVFTKLLVFLQKKFAHCFFTTH